MTISFPITPPAGRGSDIARAVVGVRNAVGLSTSPFTFEQQAYEHSAHLWTLTVELNPMNRSSADDWIAWLTSLRGRYGTFYFSIPGEGTAVGSASGTPRVQTNSESGLVLNTYGWTGSATSIMNAGDLFTIGGYLYRNLSALNTTSGGVGAMDIWPRLRSVPASGTALTVSSAYSTWRLDSEPSYEVVGPGIYYITFSAVEAL